jgi:hypothetical protein
MFSRHTPRRRGIGQASHDHDPYVLPNRDVCISPRQVQVHKSTEFLSFALGSGLLIWVATRERPLTAAEKAGVLALGVGALIVDTHLWSKFRRAKPAVAPHA